MKTLFRHLPCLVALVLLISSAHGSAFSDRIDLVRAGMNAQNAVTILGHPSSVSQGPGGTINFNYVRPEGTWQVNIYRGRVRKIEEP